MPSDEIALPTYLKQTFAQGKIEDEKINDIEVLKAEKNYLSPLHPKVLRIPVIDVDADIQYVGITKKGNIVLTSL